MDKNVDFREFFFSRFVLLLSDNEECVRSFVRLFVQSVISLVSVFPLFVLLCGYSSEFCHRKLWFFGRRKSCRRYSIEMRMEIEGNNKKNHTHKRTFEWMDCIWCRLKIFAEFQTCENCQCIYLWSVRINEKHRKSTRKTQCN